MPLFASPGSRPRPFVVAIRTAVAVAIRLVTAVIAAWAILGVAPFDAARSTVSAQPSPAAIRVVSQGSSIRYGQSIDLTLTAEADDADITSIRSFYRPRGTRTITTYGYADFEPGRRVTARLTIPTIAPTYYPPGVVFEVTYEIADAAGNRIETPPQVVEYLDPGFTWRRLTKGSLTAIYHDRPEPTMDDLLTALLGRIPRIESAVGADPGGEYKAVLFNSNAEARRAFPLVSQTAKEEHVFAGFAYEQYGLLVLDHAGVQGVTHELTHLIFGRATNSPTAKRPAWLNEGLAVYFETGSRASTASRLVDAIRSDKLLPLRAMNSIPGRPEQIDIFYPEAGNFAGYLLERHGEARMRALAQGLRDGALPAAAVIAAYGVSLEDLEAYWRRDIGAKVEPPLPTATPPKALQVTPTPSLASPQATVTGQPPAPTAGGPQPNATIEPGATATPSLTIWWFLVGLVAAAMALAVVYAIRRMRRGGP